jgi:hypothetical protein
LIGLPLTVATESAAKAEGANDKIAIAIKVWVNFMRESSWLIMGCNNGSLLGLFKV